LRLNGGEAISTKDHTGANGRWWGIYVCGSCGGVVTASAPRVGADSNPPEIAEITHIYPSPPTINESIPDEPREYLCQAQESLCAASASIMVSASAVDAMLKKKGYEDGSLYERIDKAAKDHLITDTMAEWAHQIRLDANAQRHADKDVGLPTKEDARLTFDFAIALAEYLFVLPSRVTRGIADAESPQKAT